MLQGRCEDYYSALQVALARHHAPPTTVFQVTDGDRVRRWSAMWTLPSPLERNGQRNADDCTRDAAYLMAVAAVEAERDMVVHSRTDTLTGADIQLVPAEPCIDMFERSVRLEVSGQDRGTPATLRSRLREKMEQARAGKSDLPAVAAVVGFQVAMVLVSDVEGT